MSHLDRFHQTLTGRLGKEGGEGQGGGTEKRKGTDIHHLCKLLDLLHRTNLSELSLRGALKVLGAGPCSRVPQ